MFSGGIKETSGRKCVKFVTQITKQQHHIQRPQPFCTLCGSLLSKAS